MNWGKRIILTFDRPVYHVSSLELPKWALKNAYGNLMYPINIMYGISQNIIYLDFEDFNSIAEPITLECLGCVEMGSPDLPLGEISFPFYPKNLWPIPGDFEYLALSDITVEGEIIVAFDGKVYTDEYLQLASIAVEGTYQYVEFKERHEDEYLQLASITVEGQYCDINGVPL